MRALVSRFGLVKWLGLVSLIGVAGSAGLSGCSELSIPDADGAVRVSRVTADGTRVDVAVSPARAAAVWTCLRQAVFVPGARAAADAGSASDPGAATDAERLVEGVYDVALFGADASLTQAAGGEAADSVGAEEAVDAPRRGGDHFRLMRRGQVVASDGRVFASRCLYDLIRDRSVEPIEQAW